MTVEQFNALDVASAREVLAACSGSARWVDAIVAHRPFARRAAVVDAAVAAWDTLDEGDYADAIAHHPRIGESAAAASVTPQAQRWSAAEQADVGAAGSATIEALAAANAEYESHFGRRFIVFASGKTADEILVALRSRLQNDSLTEAAAAVAELRKITLRRTEKLFASH